MNILWSYTLGVFIVQYDSYVFLYAYTDGSTSLGVGGWETYSLEIVDFLSGMLSATR